MRKHAQIKKNHHYVWGFHIKQWAKGNDVFYITKKGKIACDSVNGLSRERGFYKINPLKKSDVVFLQGISKKSDKHLQDQHAHFLSDFLILSHVYNTHQNNDIKTEEENTAHLAIIYNSLENIHSSFESGVKPVMEELHKGVSEALNISQNMIAFCSYLGQQFTRTKAFKKKSIVVINKNIATMKESHSNIDEYRKILNLTERNWWFLSFMLGINIGFSLYRSRYENNHIFIVNDTNTPFITSDNPIINIHSSLSDLRENEAPEKLDLYFPISPRYAYMINDSSAYNEFANSIDTSSVQKLNRLMAKKADETIFGSSKEILKSVKNQFRDRNSTTTS